MRQKAYEMLVHFYATGVGYAEEMGNRPQTLYGIADSPVGLAAWMIDHDGASYELIARAFVGDAGGLSRDDVLDNVTHYWLTNTGSPLVACTGRAISAFFDVKGVEIPVGVSVFPDELYPAPRSWAEKAYPKLIHFNTGRRGRPLRRLGAAAAPLRRRFGRPSARCASRRRRHTMPARPSPALRPWCSCTVHSPTLELERRDRATAGEGRPHDRAPANPAARDLDRLRVHRRLARRDAGPVIAVGHSYGGAVITNAAGQAKNVVGLVFVAAFAPKKASAWPMPKGPRRTASSTVRWSPLHYPATGGEPAVEFAIDPASFHDAFAADLPAEEAAVMAATQRPVAELAFSEPTGRPPGRTCPPGPSSPPAIKRAGTDVIRRWPSARARRSRRSRAPT